MWGRQGINANALAIESRLFSSLIPGVGAVFLRWNLGLGWRKLKHWEGTMHTHQRLDILKTSA